MNRKYSKSCFLPSMASYQMSDNHQERKRGKEKAKAVAHIHCEVQHNANSSI